MVFLLMTTSGHSSIDNLQSYDVGAVEQEALLAAQYCIERALEAMPAGEGSEAYINMNNVMRQLGCDRQAHNLTWLHV